MSLNTTDSNQQSQITAGLQHFFVQQFYKDHSTDTECQHQMCLDVNTFADTELSKMMEME